MVETAIFSIFHRETPAKAEAPIVVEPTQPAHAPVKHGPAEPENVLVSGDARGSVEGDPAPLPAAAVIMAQPEPAPSPVVLPVAPPIAAPPVARLGSISAGADLLGLANPIVFTLHAQLDGSGEIPLYEDGSGIYRPPGFRAAPWSGFGYDTTPDTRTGLLAGTRILTARGEIEVEKLHPGDSVMTLRGPALLPITWIGRSAATEAPIRIGAGALGPDMPRRALSVAPDHPVFIDPVPVPARSLVNGTTIYAVDIADAELFHIDVGTAEVLFAEGVPLSSGQRSSVPSPV